jgi:hypothetical protein
MLPHQITWHTLNSSNLQHVLSNYMLPTVLHNPYHHNHPTPNTNNINKIKTTPSIPCTVSNTTQCQMVIGSVPRARGWTKLTQPTTTPNPLVAKPAVGVLRRRHYHHHPWWHPILHRINIPCQVLHRKCMNLMRLPPVLLIHRLRLLVLQYSTDHNGSNRTPAHALERFTPRPRVVC